MTGLRSDLGVVVRPLRWWDIQRVVELEQVLFPTDSPWTAAMFWAELAAGHHYVAHRAADGILDGYAGLAVQDDRAEVQTIGVDPAAQHRGIGRALLCNLLAASGQRPVHLEVRTDNACAIALYESEGFVRVGLRGHYYTPSGADAFTMTRPGRS